ncbi:MAG: UvrD-helicase domain-containing protein [Mailhella sp.]|nr:UvrD-helicase domain-containing protein [Mailhella sp.]
MGELRQIRASAGAGKTYTLTSLFMEKLHDAVWDRSSRGCILERSAEESYGWQEILAITFTNAAAEEMRGRLLVRLKEIGLRNSSIQNSRPDKHAWTAAQARDAVDMILRSYSALNMRTIDSLLNLIVRLSALDLQIPPEFEPSFNNDDVTGPVFDDLAEQARCGENALTGMFRFACRLMLDDPGETGFLCGKSMRSRVMQTASVMLDYGSTGIATGNEAQQIVDSFHAQLTSTAKALLSAIQSLSVNAHLLRALEKCSLSRSVFQLPDSKMLDKNSLDDCLNKCSRGMASPDAVALYEKLTKLYRRTPVFKGALHLLPFTDLGHAVLEELPACMGRRGVIPFSQVARMALAALHVNEADPELGVSRILCRLGTPFSHILIDEFQDTSRSQWEVLRPFAGEALSGGGSLTIVGDVKQSIYGWRGGDSSLFNEIDQDPAIAVAHSGKSETLKENWRSRKHIISWNNTFFSPLREKTFVCRLWEELHCPDEHLLREQQKLLSDAFADTEQNPSPCTKDEGHVTVSRWKPCTDRQQEDQLLRELVLCRVTELRQRGFQPRSICILTRSNAQCQMAAKWLLESGLPVVTESSLLIAEQPVIAELISLLRFLDSPDDNPQFWSFVSGRHLIPPEFRPSQEELAEWALTCKNKAKDDKLLLAGFKKRFPACWHACIEPLISETGLITPYDLVSELLKRWHTGERCPDQLGFLLRMLEILHDAEEKGMTDLPSFLAYWDKAGSIERVPMPENMNAVRVMTMHKAKGLAFDVVLLPWMNSRLCPGHKEILPWQDEESGRILLAPACEAMGRMWHEKILANARESINLMYVSMTRARIELHCFLPYPDEKEGRDGAFLRMLGIMLDTLARNHHQHTAIAPLLGDMNHAPAEGEMLSWGIPECPDPSSGKLHENTVDGKHPCLTPLKCKEKTTGESWRPMQWLPKLSLFRSNLHDMQWSPKKRGTLIHHCLEYLNVGNGQSMSAAAALAVRRGCASFPMSVPVSEKLIEEMTEDLAWYASLPEARLWLETGSPERELLDVQGRAHRVDLLADDGSELTAVEYKTGTPGLLPNDVHLQQLKGYLSLIHAAEQRPVRGVLVYLDRRQIHYVSLEE